MYGAVQSAPGMPRRTHLAAAVRPPTGHGFFAMALLSMRRAFRLRIDANEVLDDERKALLACRPPVADETQQAFLAWRRSVLFMAALIMVPVALLHALTKHDGMPEGWKTLQGVAVAVEIGFTIFLWIQVPRWTQWKRQARALSWAWIIYFVTPFLVFLYPIASSMDVSGFGDNEEQRKLARLLFGMAIGANALFSLAPKIISLLQGMIRASIATKTLFPGASAPGWLMVISAPLYMIIFYVFVLLPYHFTVSGLVIIGMFLIVGAKATLVRAGLRLTRPMRDEEARAASARAQALWVGLLLAGSLFIVGGLWELVSSASVLTLVSFALSMSSNVLLLTLISTDGLISGLDRARGTSAEERALADEVQGQLAAFTGAGSEDLSKAAPPARPSAPPGLAPPAAPVAPPR